MRLYYFSRTMVFLFFALSLVSCADTQVADRQPVKTEEAKQNSKPPSSYQDTFFVTVKSAVFYEPDSIQLNRIKALTNEAVYESSMHEYEYQFKNAKKLLAANWKDVRVETAKNVRYVHFSLSNGKVEVIDLDKFNDAFGLFAFDPVKVPTPIEMTNAQSLLADYFERH